MEMYSKLNRCKHKGLQVYSSCTVAVVSLDVGLFVVILRGCDTVSSLFLLLRVHTLSFCKHLQEAENCIQTSASGSI